MERAVVALFRLVLISALGLGALGYVCRNRVGTALFQRLLAQRPGLQCTQPDVFVAASLNYVRLSPLHCRVSEGPVRAFATGVTHLRLLRLRVRSAELEFASVDYRARDLSHIKTSAPAAPPQAELSVVRQTLVRSMLDASEMYSADIPRIAVKTLTAKREGRVQLVMHGFRKSMDGTWDRIQAERVECPEAAGLVVQALDMRVVPGWGNLSATLRLGPRRQSPPKRMALRLEGRRLDGIRPRVVAELGPLAQRAGVM